MVARTEGLRTLENEWRALADATTDAVFLSWDWVDTWWAHYGARWGDELHVVTMRDGSGGLTGLAPLYVSRPSRADRSVRARLRGATLKFLGSGGDTSPDYLGLLAAPGRERVVAEALASHLSGSRRPAWDALHLTDLAEDAPATDALNGALARGFGFATPLHSAPQAVCPHVDLPSTVEELHARLPGKLRYNVRRRKERLERDHGAKFFLWDASRGPVSGGIDQIAALHRKRFTARGERHGFSSDAYVEFHRAVAERFAHRGLLRLHCLEVRGSVVAMLYCFRFGDRIYHFQSGFDPDCSKLGVGQVLIAHALEDAIREGVRRFDFLKGEYDYKADWATGHRRTNTLTGGRLTRGGVVHLYDTVLRPRLASLARAVLR